jgi:hypothetical protein
MQGIATGINALAMTRFPVIARRAKPDEAISRIGNIKEKQ